MPDVCREPSTRGENGYGPRPALRVLWVLAVFLLGAVAAQPAGQQVPNPLGRHQTNPFSNSSDLDPLLAARQLRALNEERQKAIVSDTERLLKLVRELNTEIASGSADTLTATQVRNLVEIEKLARNVKQKMSVSLVGGPALREPATEPIQ
ncbi:MAG: hypothetical protein WBV28_05150 [Terracidiphilus sp.]